MMSTRAGVKKTNYYWNRNALALTKTCEFKAIARFHAISPDKKVLDK